MANPTDGGGGRRSAPPRLTDVEWSALGSAVLALQGNVEGEDDPASWRELRAAERALAKVYKHLRPRRNAKGRS